MATTLSAKKIEVGDLVRAYGVIFAVHYVRYPERRKITLGGVRARDLGEHKITVEESEPIDKLF